MKTDLAKLSDNRGDGNKIQTAVPSPASCLDPLSDPASWSTFVAVYADKHQRQQHKIQAFTELLPRSPELAATILNSQYKPGIPRRLAVSKRDGPGKRLVFVYSWPDELIMKICSRLCAGYSALLPDCCHAFRAGRSARGAFQSLLHRPGLGRLSCIRIDIADFFNSIDPERALAALPLPIQDDKPLMDLLRQVLLQDEYVQNQIVQQKKPAGIKPGTPLAPILANFYLAGLDRYYQDSGYPYARYSDDIILFVPPEQQTAVYADLCVRLAALGLAVNAKKTALLAPGVRWEYLGFSYDHGRIDLSEISVRKLRDRVRRLARRLNRYRCRRQVPPAKILIYFFRRLNGRLYGYTGQPSRFSWTRWYLPVINTTISLDRLDAYIQEAARFACTGRYRRANYRLIPYEQLKAAGCRPLLPCYYTRSWRHDKPQAEQPPVLREKDAVRSAQPVIFRP
ncbi:MAG: reverse transcriptase domain-containing protein [Clostridiaceae bacterium]|nr:reverse transcriptase domain-containing protein [Clostridiaceae bacterium]